MPGTPKKPKAPPKPSYDIHAGRAFAADKGVVKDAVGYVYFSNLKDPKLLLENKDGIQNAALLTATNDKIVSKNPAFSDKNITSFYATYAENSNYDKFATTGKIVTNISKVTGPSVYVSKIQLAAGILTVEILLDDPWLLKGTDNSPYDFLKTIAITNAEHQSIVDKINNPVNNIDTKASIWLEQSAFTTIPNSGQRNYYKANIVIKGTTNESSGKTPINPPISTGIDIYSVDQNNWTSVNYANAASIPGVTWNNNIIPEPIAGATNPFGTVWASLKSTLQSIKNEADNLPVAGDNKGYRLFNGTSIRRYIYQGDLEKATFDIAFRLPFFTENIAQNPYLNINGRPNNPYYAKFESWFQYANNLRTVAGYAPTKLLSRAGLNQGFVNAIQGNPDHLELYSLFDITRNSSFTDRRVPAFMAKVMEDENPQTTYVSKHKNVVHFPAQYASTKVEFKVPDNGNNLNEVLSTMESLGIISAANTHQIKNYFLTSAINSFQKRVNPSAINGYYVIKSGIASMFLINDLSIYQVIKKVRVPNPANNSGWTGMGYDVGQNTSYAKFLNYTEFEINEEVDKEVFTEAMDIKKTQAAALYESYKGTIINKYIPSYDIAVKNTVPFMKESYLKGALDTYGADDYWVTRPNVSYYFYNANTVQYLNEIEKMIFLSQVYNGGGNILKNVNRSKLLAHAFNQHDYRWLKYYAIKAKGGLAVYPQRKTDLITFMNGRKVYDHYDIKQVTL